LRPLSSIIVGNFYELQPGSICHRGGHRELKGTPKGPKGRPKGAKGSPSKGTPKGPKGRPKGAQGLPNESKRNPKSVPGAPKALKRHPKAAKGSQREKIYIKKLPINRPSGRYVNIYVGGWIPHNPVMWMPRSQGGSRRQPKEKAEERR